MATIPSPVLVTGASTGIGRATVGALVRSGTHVVASVRKDADADRLAGEHGDAVDVVRFDITDTEVVRATVGRFDRLGAVVDNAGVAVAGPLEYLPPDDFRQQLEVNLIGQLAVIQAALPALRAYGAGARIVTIGSIGGRVTGPLLGAYHASKFALAAVSDTLRLELAAAGIGVTLVEPGGVRTPIWRRGRAAGEELLARMPAAASERYGRLIDRVVAGTVAAERSGLPPEAVADVVLRVLGARRPPPRQLVGRDAHVAALVAYLPHRLRARVLALAAG